MTDEDLRGGGGERDERCGRHPGPVLRPPQQAEEQRGQHVPGTTDGAVGDLDRRQRQQYQGRADQRPQPGGPDPPVHGVVDEQRAQRGDAGPGQREGHRDVHQRQVGDQLADEAGHELLVAAVGHEQVPRVRQGIEQVHALVFGVERVPGRDAGDAQQQYDGPDAHGGHLDGDVDSPPPSGPGSVRVPRLGLRRGLGLGPPAFGRLGEEHDQGRAHPAQPAIGRPGCRPRLRGPRLRGPVGQSDLLARSPRGWPQPPKDQQKPAPTRVR